MSEKPTKRKWILRRPVADDAQNTIWCETDIEPYSDALFRGHERLANAELFLRAQHMDELVGAIQPFMVTMRQLEAEFLDTRSGRQEIVLDAQTVTHPIKDNQYIVSGFRHTYFFSEEIALQISHFRKVAAILSKIEGKQ